MGRHLCCCFTPNTGVKIERPFRELKASFLEEITATGGPCSIAELNARASSWLATYVDPRPHRVTGVPPATRFAAEAPLLAPLPRVRYDTARIEPRRVGAPVPLVEVDAVSYSAPPALAGTLVEVCLPVDAGVIQIRARGLVVATHAHAPPGSDAVWDPAHRKEAEALALAPHTRHLELVTDNVDHEPVLDLGDLLGREPAPAAEQAPPACSMLARASVTDQREADGEPHLH